MTLDRGILANIDRRILSTLDNEEGMQLVRVPVSDALWSTWRSYCDALGVSMGKGIAALIAHELQTVVREDLEHLKLVLSQRKRSLDQREAAITLRELELKERELQVAASERQGLTRGFEPRDVPFWPSLLAQEIPKVGRNDPCPCGSGEKYKRCHTLSTP